MFMALVMGNLGRIEGNVMTYVRASNMKLIDRAVRYIEELLKRDGYQFSEEEIIQQIFNNNFLSDKPIVLRVREDLIKTL